MFSAREEQGLALRRSVPLAGDGPLLSLRDISPSRGNHFGGSKGPPDLYSLPPRTLRLPSPTLRKAQITAKPCISSPKAYIITQSVDVSLPYNCCRIYLRFRYPSAFSIRRRWRRSRRMRLFIFPPQAPSLSRSDDFIRRKADFITQVISSRRDFIAFSLRLGSRNLNLKPKFIRF